MLTADADDSLLWLLLSPPDGSGAEPPELGLARMTSLWPPADVLCAAAADDDDDVPVLTGIPSNCCLLDSRTSNITIINNIIIINIKDLVYKAEDKTFFTRPRPRPS